ncbi:Methyltransferase domain-containing protein [Caenorhabditis elegans]|uniref:Methyltransferase domain-containing protein n=1 Tax=Caenorhabditis elegans TaxID=6239 RepID=O61833_CAEEL|nr:Methyltransferase domain-containing protein [Caenorhabditis elegans]CCD65350.1 Methyltransferase domain-containing protein [Caenorhabditis elegans]|eukprot:NP_500168.2 PRotein arginine MethylTransferase [Caenorhabditis elegans]
MSDFPSEAYTEAQQKWLGRDHLITPTIKKAFGHILVGKEVLDVGCGNGHYSFDFLRWGAHKVFGVDNSEEMIQICKSSPDFENFNSKIDFLLGEVTNFHVDGASFDVATAFFVLQFLHKNDDVALAIQNISRHLKSRGTFFGLIPNGVPGVRAPENMGLKLGAQIQKEPESPFVDGEVVGINFYANGEVCGSSKIALHSREFYEQCFKAAGFSQIEWIAPHFTDHAKNLLGEQFCFQFLNPPCDIMFKCVKM